MWFTKIKSEEHLDSLLAKYKLKKYINYRDNIIESCTTYPILKQFIMDASECVFSSEKINIYLDKQFVPHQAYMSSFNVNNILNELKTNNSIE